MENYKKKKQGIGGRGGTSESQRGGWCEGYVKM